MNDNADQPRHPEDIGEIQAALLSDTGQIILNNEDIAASKMNGVR